jgi:hypothetical protein
MPHKGADAGAWEKEQEIDTSGGQIVHGNNSCEPEHEQTTAADTQSGKETKRSSDENGN